MASLPPVPMRVPVLEHASDDPNQKQPFRAVFHQNIVRWLNLLRTGLGNAAQRIGLVNITTQSAAIAATDIPTPTLEEGLYRTSFSLRITRAASVSSSAGVTIGWTFNSTSCSQVFTAVTGNTLDTQSNGTVTMAVDAGTAITYAVSYSSVGGTSMQYSFDTFVESIP